MRNLISSTVALCIAMLAFLALPATGQDAKRGLVYIKGGGLFLAVAPEAGGRAVEFGFEGGRSVLKTDLAELESGAYPEPALKLPYKPVHGHEIWVSPQDAWWTQQDLDPKRKAAASTWPPDPWSTHSRFRVVEQSPSSIVLEGQPSPISGLSMTKSYALTDAGAAVLKVSAKNCRESAVEWGLWSNTRFDGALKCFVPVENKSVRIECEPWEPFTMRALQFDISEGLFTFALDPQKPGISSVAKAFLNPPKGALAALGPDFLFIKAFTLAPQAKIPKRHAPAEVFQLLSWRPEESLLELEFHGPLQRIEPGASISLEEQWRLIRVKPETSRETLLRELK